MNQTYNVRLSNNSPRDSDDDFRLIVDNLYQDYLHSDDPTTFFSEAFQQATILNYWFFLANRAPVTGSATRRTKVRNFFEVEKIKPAENNE